MTNTDTHTQTPPQEPPTQAQQIDVASMRNKSNRLEELFLGIVENSLTEKL